MVLITIASLVNISQTNQIKKLQDDLAQLKTAARLHTEQVTKEPVKLEKE